MNVLAWLADPNFRWVLAGSVLLGMSSGALGAFALLRKRSLMGDVLSHAALPGICLAFMVSQSKSVGVLLAGAAVTGLGAAAAVNAITRHSRIKADTALGLVLTVSFGAGILLLTKIAQSGAASQAGLDRFLFGQAASMVAADVRVMAGVSAALTLLLIAFFHEFKLICFDMDYAKGIGRPVAWIDSLLLVLIVGAVVVGLQAVGVVLMSAMLITPAIAARYWTERLSVMVVLAAAFGGIAGALGTVVSTAGLGLSTGPLIVLAATAVFFLSLLFAPERGLVARALRHAAVRRRVEEEHVLRALFELEEVAGRCAPDLAPGPAGGEGAESRSGPVHGAGDIEAWRADFDGRRLARTLRRLERKGLVKRVDGAGFSTAGESARAGRPAGATGSGSAAAPGYRLTERGTEAAYRIVRSHRMWEMFLMHEAELGVEHVDRHADVLEHHLPESVVAQVERLLREQGREPALPPSAHPLGPHPLAPEDEGPRGHAKGGPR